jgi:hypothetical protein
MSSHVNVGSPRLLVGLLVSIGRELRLARYALEAVDALSTRPDAMRATVAINSESLRIPSRTEDAIATLAEVSRKVTEVNALLPSNRVRARRAPTETSSPNARTR